MVAYAPAANVPRIIIQRFTRHRLRSARRMTYDVNNRIAKTRRPEGSHQEFN